MFSIINRKKRKECGKKGKRGIKKAPPEGKP
jgi:hypothetical protein